MKSKLLILLSVLSLQLAISQNYQTVEEVNDACSQLGFMGDEDAETAVNNILSQVGLFSNFTIQECPEINNAVAKMIDEGDSKKARYILYDRDFFKRIEDKASNDWAAISILAHEIGHHLNGHALNDEGSNHKWELEADGFSGFVLARMGASLTDAQSAINTFKLEKATRTHPAKKDRLNAIEIGWNRGNGKLFPVKKITEGEQKIIDYEVEIMDTEDKKVLAQKILANYIDAIGGEENIINVKSLFKKVKYSLKTLMNGVENVSEFELERTYLTPNKQIIKDGKFFELELGARKYKKDNQKDKWIFFSNITKREQVSYVLEYSILVKNEDIEYLGVENFNEVSSYAIRLPNRTYVSITDFASQKKITKSIHYYNIETGLLVGAKNNVHFITEHNNENVKNIEHTQEELEIYSNYKEINGVLFPTNLTKVKEGEKYKTEFNAESKEIVVNPNVNPDAFKVKR
jgi:hypothetical protein